MGWFDGKSAEEEAIQKAHDEGQKDGSEGKGTVYEINAATAYRLTGGEKVADAYRAGLENGRNNPAK